MALSVRLSRFTPRVGGGSAFFVRRIMSRLQSHELIKRSGERIVIYVADDGRSACPVCGILLSGEWAWDYYWAADEHGNKIGEPHAGASFNICPCCNTQFGFDDYVERGSQTDRWAALRRKWLERAPRNLEVVEQLQNIGVKI